VHLASFTFHIIIAIFSSFVAYFTSYHPFKQVLRKADMIRKNAVESILAERDILITLRNPFVVSEPANHEPDFKSYNSKWSCFCQVRFFYSFTSRENLYLVMEYLNGGDLYSLLRNLGCLDEDVARVYLAEVVSF
jgi:serine/threonine protein kinase